MAKIHPIFYWFVFCRLLTVSLSKIGNIEKLVSIFIGTDKYIRMEWERERERENKWKNWVKITHQQKIRSQCQIANTNRHENLSQLLLISHLLVSCFLLFARLGLLFRVFCFSHSVLFLVVASISLESSWNFGNNKHHLLVCYWRQYLRLIFSMCRFY